MSRRSKPVRKIHFNIYPLDDWLLKELAGPQQQGRYQGEAEEIRRALRVYAAILGVQPPKELCKDDC